VKLLRKELLQTEAFAHRSFYTEKLLHTQTLWHNDAKIAAPKKALGAKAQKKDHFEALFKRNFKSKISSAKIEKIC